MHRYLVWIGMLALMLGVGCAAWRTGRQSALAPEAPVALEMPFWQTETMVNESVMMVARDGKPAEAPLLFRPIRILSVKNARLETPYAEGRDWELKNGKLHLPPGSKAPFMTLAELYPAQPAPGEGMPQKDGGVILFHEGHFFHDRQLVVTYTHAAGAWAGPAPRPAPPRPGPVAEHLQKTQGRPAADRGALWRQHLGGGQRERLDRSSATDAHLGPLKCLPRRTPNVRNN